MSSLCVVIDYGSGNVFSVMRALHDFPVRVELTADPATIKRADYVILPGVGAFAKAADRLRASHLIEPMLEYIRTERPFLGICVGMQLLFDSSDEFGYHPGLGLIGGTVERIAVDLREGRHLRVPLIGWHPLAAPATNAGRWTGTLLEQQEPANAFYFVHSYAASVANPADLLAVTRHDGQEITAAVQRGNIIGTQFHPERSAGAGKDFLRSFLRL